ncbi:ABC transporter permease [Vagococcus xieshaowenii]|uniref:ABC transporter permease n=1 Tax=Vagococcus xieshaowenii TaxID=2562451 RepID=A0AAJ5EFD1_9ENTE|nr:ABC transporter permease [Vagococcus xieshaowenii]QCA28608.1 ABC transporter permease [Vagococcus xieshaowenii]TFZ40584.1 ABC transporter permease [Vagococcus xieshaowenii]
MKSGLYLKSTFKDIKASMGRFIAVVIIILMGVLLFVGIKSVGPNLELTADHYFDKQRLSDFQIVSTLGLTDEDEQLVSKVKGSSVEMSKNFSYADEKHNLILQVYGYNASHKQNQLEVMTGHLPQEDNQVVVDYELRDTYKIGEELTIKSDDLSKTNYQIVGYVQTPLYMDVDERGVTTIGDGVLKGFVYLPEENFTSEIFSTMYVSFDDMQEKSSFSKDYEKQTLRHQAAIEQALKPRENARLDEIKSDAQTEINENRQKLEDNEDKLASGITQVKEGLKTITDQYNQLTEKFELLRMQTGEALANVQFGDSIKQLESKKQELTDQLAELNQQQATLTKGKQELADSQQELDKMKPARFIVNPQSNNPGYTEYQSLSERIDAIANVFPVFFFLIAILITFTTITRMVEENRKEIGTLKALGYRNGEIASKYILYTLLAAFIGTTIGVLVGAKLLPQVVFDMQQANNIFPVYTSEFFLVPILIAVLAALASTLGSALLVLSRDLREKPTALLMPKAPKAGKRVFLERITPIWHRLNFFQKVTYRNIFRYKARMILTIMGIAGCTGLMIAGFGLNDSIAAPVKKQFNELVHYQSIVSLTDAEQPEKAIEVLDTDVTVQTFMPIYSEQMTIREKNKAAQFTSVMITDDQAKLEKFVTLRDEKTNKKLVLPKEGALISPRIAKTYEVSTGDTLALETTEGTPVKVKVAGIIENYLGHAIYLSKAYYQTVVNESIAPNTLLVQTNHQTKKQEQRLAEALIETGEVLNTTFISDQIEKQDLASESLGAIVAIFIILSGTLAFVVLYNLTNINISERERELATIKVLGFYDKEVTMHIIRENMVFTIIGILVGFGVGKLLTWFILAMASSDMMVFPVIIKLNGYLISALMTAVFSSIVMWVTHIKLKHINMIEALKSNE